MKVNEAIKETAHAILRGEISSSDCDIRCTLNDLIDYERDYNQPRAIKRVRNRVVDLMDAALVYMRESE